MTLIKNSILNIAGAAIPAVVAVPAIGFLARALGPELFGMLTLAWALVGYATLFDLGLSRALSQYVARPTLNEEESKAALGSAAVAVVASGIVLLALFYVVGPSIADHVFKASPQNREDAIQGMQLLGATVPFLLLTLIVQGYLEGSGRFAESNLQKAIGGSLTFLLPALCVMHEASFRAAVFGILLARIASMIIGIIRCNVYEPVWKWNVRISTMRELAVYGGGIALTNTISPIMGYLDRFFLSSLHGAQHVSQYTGAAELVSRLSIVPVAISRALFPQLVATTARETGNKRLVSSARMYTAVSCVPVGIVVFLFAKEILTLWLGNELAKNAGPVLQVLVIGFVFNAFAQIPFSTIQARGQSYLTAKIQLAEVVPYLLLLVWLSQVYGAIGAAIAWTVRIGFDLVIMEYFSRKRQ